MKIVHISLLGPFTDGWNYQENLLTKYHRRLGHDVTIVLSTQSWNEDGKVVDLPAGSSVNADGVKMLRLESRKSRLGSRFNRFPALERTLESEKADVLFIHGCQMLDTDVLVRYIKTHAVRAYVDNHADFTNSARGWLSRNVLHKLLWRYSAQRLAPHVEKFYGVLPARVDFLRNIYHTPAEKTELLVMGVDDDLADAAARPEVRAEIRARHGIAQDDFLIVTGGKIDAAKAQTLFLMEAVGKIDAPKLKLLVFGSVDPALKDRLDALCADRVQYIGWVQAVDSYAYFAAADLVAFPGRHSVFWEQAAGQGIPLLVKRWEGTEHVDLGGNTLFIEEDTADAIQHSIENIFFHPDVYANMKSVAEEKGRRVFSYLNIAKHSLEA